MQTLDLRKLLKPYFTARADPALLTVPVFSYLMIDGKGNPNTAPQYVAALQALYSLAYTLKFSLKKTAEVDYPVMALEGLWWADDMESFTQGQKDNWYWTMMILQPDLVTPESLESARVDVERKKPGLPVSTIRLERFEEGRSAQVLHIGPYADEGPNIARLHEFIAQSGLQRRGKHHEIYLGDPNRTAPEKLRTIIRQPVA
jgi:hypothetical protein